ncbi:YoaK family protein [Paraburkholderia sp. RL17-337-BIB-A]|uniref:YoaK family protein n=1 Tax=Paraburkholderia sp. RL17-337-BIB-A TaxID=3031636 RepID=UPI0038B75EC9
MDIERAEASRNVAVLLTLSGGFLDAFTYLGHGKVFASSMTGNIVLLAINLGAGDWHQAGRHISPIVGFACAVLAAYLLQLTAPRWARNHALISLVFEIVFLLMASLRGLPEFWLIPGISFVATLQTMFFTHSGNVTYTSVMTTANLRRCMQLFLESTIPRRDASGLNDAAMLGVISLSFAIGALVGGLTTPRLHDAGLCVPAALLFIALLDICRRLQRGNSTVTSGAASRPDGQVSRRKY